MAAAEREPKNRSRSRNRGGHGDRLRGLRGGDKTAGVGTWMYASPEQTAGRAYDSAADMFSVGVILFEMLHCISDVAPWGTRMERVMVMGAARRGEMPRNWQAKRMHPDLCDLMMSLLSVTASARPTAGAVVARCELLRGRRVLVPPTPSGGGDGGANTQVVLRVEGNADQCTKMMNACTTSIEETWPDVNITQCGRRTQGDVAVLEFVCEVKGRRETPKGGAKGKDEAVEARREMERHVEEVLVTMRELAGVHVARKVL